MVNYVQAQNLPSLGEVSKNQININTGSNFLIVSEISDGDLNADQTLSLEVTSSNSAIIQVDSVGYTQGSSYAYIKVTEKGLKGAAILTVKATDADGTTTKDFNLSVDQYLQRGIKWSVYDIVFWQKVIPLNEKSLFDSVLTQISIPTTEAIYETIPLTVGPSSGLPKHDFFTSMFKGYLVPPATGTYTFHLNTFDESALFLSPDLSFSKATQLTRGTRSTTNTATATLEAGKAYAIYAVNWCIHELQMNVQWEGPGVTKSIIDSKYLFPSYDIQKPTTPLNTKLVFTGVETARFSWKKSIDNENLNGYNIYLNGVKLHTTKDTSFILGGLTANTPYSVFVTAFDATGNESLADKVINFSTYPVDSQKPTSPTGVQAAKISDMSATIAWKKATDVGSEIFGYNLYLDGKLYNTAGAILDTMVVVKVLTPLTNYSVQVEAIDGGKNLSDKSESFAFKTNKFDPLISAPGVKKARLNVYTQEVGRNEGFGVNGNYRDNKFYTTEKYLLEELKPSVLRWGALDANVLAFKDNVGAQTFTYGKFLKFCNDLGTYAAIVTGVKDGLDWRTDINTFAHFIEYLNGPATSTYGKIRASEGLTEPLFKNSKGVIIELGNEVWGAASHNSEIGADYTAYAEWCRQAAKVMKSSPYYDSTKVYIAYSGRYPDPLASAGLNTKLITGDKGEVDWITVSGYLGGNMNYDPAIPTGQNEIDYFKNGIERMAKQIEGTKLQLRLDHKNTGRYLPTYFYESNMTTPNYNGRLGQALIMTDYMLSVQKWAGAVPTIFHLTGGEWRITEPSENFKRLPLFKTSKLVNHHTKGNILKSEVVTSEKLTNGAGTIIANLDAVGSHVYSENGRYSIMFISRDFENDYQVQVNLPDGIPLNSTAKKYVLSGVDFNTKDAVVDSSNVTLSDSMFVTVPKHSLVLYVFDGTDLKQKPLPIGYTRFLKISNLTIVPENGTSITTNGQTLTFSAKLEPTGVLFKDVQWSVGKSSTLKVNSSLLSTGKFTVQGSGTCEGNGTIKLRIQADYDTTIFNEVTVNIENQKSSDISTCANSVEDAQFDNSIRIFPNPTKSSFFVESELGYIKSIRIFNALGEEIVGFKLNQKDGEIDLSNFPQGVYFIEIDSQSKTLRRKLLKN